MNTTHRCPGQDKRFWKSEDIIEVKCPYCSSIIEFWKDDPMRYCSDCGEIINNPQINLNCAKWCKMAEECLGKIPEGALAASPVIERLKALFHKQLINAPEKMSDALDALLLAETILIKETGDPSVIKPAVMFAGTLFSRETDQSGTTPLGDASNWHVLLQKSGMEETTTRDKIVRLIEAAGSNQPIDSDDFSIVWDAIQLQRLDNMDLDHPLAGTALNILASIKTKCGNQIAKRFQK